MPTDRFNYLVTQAIIRANTMFKKPPKSKKQMYPEKAYLLSPGKEPKEIHPENKINFERDELYTLLCCSSTIILHSLRKGPVGKFWRNAVLVVDENGKSDKKAPNQIASEWYANPEDIVVGDAILCPTSMLK